MIGFLDKLRGKCPECGNKMSLTKYNPKQPKKTAICCWEHYRRIKSDGKNKTIKYCNDCYNKLSKTMNLDDIKPFTLIDSNDEGLGCNLCGKPITLHQWYHTKMYLELDVSPDKRSHYIVKVCDLCFRTLGEDMVTKELQKTGFV